MTSRHVHAGFSRNRFLTKVYAVNTELPLYGPRQKEVFVTLPYCGMNSVKIKRQLHRLIAKVAPWIELKALFKTSQNFEIFV